MQNICVSAVKIIYYMYDVRVTKYYVAVTKSDTHCTLTDRTADPGC